MGEGEARCRGVSRCMFDRAGCSGGDISFGREGAGWWREGPSFDCDKRSGVSLVDRYGFNLFTYCFR